MVTVKELKARVPRADTMVVERYQLVRRLGRGGFGEVWQAQDLATRQTVALKLLSQMDNTRHLERFREEFALLTKLSHPHINPVLEFGRDARYGYFFTAALVQGVTLLDATADGAPEIVETLIVQALQALAYLHQHQTYHFDIKPQNLLVARAADGTLHLKLIDFGLAALAPTAEKAGTPGYMAPELIVGHTVDGRADLYALGVVLYVCLTRNNPFRTELADTTWHNHLTFHPPRVSTIRANVPAHLDELVERLLKKSPTDRYASADHALRDLCLMSPHRHRINEAETRHAYLPAGGLLIGRATERARVRNIFDGKAQTLMVYGAAGLGKTALLRQGQYEAQLRDLCVLSCWEPLLRATAHFFSALAELLAHPPQRPTLVLLDNIEAWLHAAAPTAQRELIHTLIRQLHSGALPQVACVCGVQQREQLPADFQHIEHIVLTPFSTPEIAEYLDAVIAVPAALRDTVIAHVLRSSAGIPALIHATVATWLQRAYFVDAAGRWDDSQFDDITLDLEHVDVPQALWRSALQTIEHVSTPARHTLECLVAWEQAASVETVRAFTDNADTGATLHELVQQQCVHHDPINGTYAVANAAVRAAVQANTPAATWMQWHDRLAQHAIATGATATVVLSHHARGSDPHRAQQSLLQWGEALRAEGQLVIAIDHIEERLRTLPTTLPAEARHELQRLAAELLLQADRLDDAKKFLAAWQQSLSPTDVLWHARVWELLAGVALRAEQLVAAHSDLQHALSYETSASHTTAADPALWLRVRNGLARIALLQGDTFSAIAAYRVTALQQSALDAATQSTITNNELGHALIASGAFREAIDTLTVEITHWRTAHDARVLANRLYHLGEAHRHLGEYGHATTHLTEAVHCARSVQDLRLLATIHNGLGNVALMSGALQNAIAAYERALPLCYRIGDLPRVAALSINLARLCLQQHTTARAEQLLRATQLYLDTVTTAPTWIVGLRCPTLQLLGECARQQQQWDDAQKYLHSAWTLANTDTTSEPHRFGIAVTLAEVAWESGHHSTYEEWLALAAQQSHAEIETAELQRVRALSV